MTKEKTTIFAMVVVFVTTGIGFASLTDGLVAYYPFNGNANDESGNNRHGTLGGDATIVWDTGSNRKGAGNVLKLDGDGDYAIVDASQAPPMSPAGTVAGWVNIPATFPFPRWGAGFVNKMIHSSGWYLYEFAIGHDGPCFAGIGDGSSAPGSGKHVYWSDDVDERRAIQDYLFDDSWHHLAYTWDSDELVLYVDGVFQNSTTHAINVYVNDPMNWDLNIGRRPYASTTNWKYLQGSIDEIRIYNRALSEEEIRQLASTMIEATIDLDPDTLNLKSKGKWITCYIELPEGYDVEDIDVDSILLETVLGVEHSDVQDGVLMVKFDRQDLIIYLKSVIGVVPPEEVTLTVTGELTDGTPFEGTDTIRVIDEG